MIRCCGCPVCGALRQEWLRIWETRSNDHVHIDWKDSKGKLVGTDHYRWRTTPGWAR